MKTDSLKYLSLKYLTEFHYFSLFIKIPLALKAYLNLKKKKNSFIIIK